MTEVIDGPNIILGSGGYFPLVMPTIQDVAWSLACESRWSGQTTFQGKRCFYSVAQHCCLIVLACSVNPMHSDLMYQALMHELPEFALGDFAGPFKREVPEYKSLENRFNSELRPHFGVPDLNHDSKFRLKDLDIRMLATERRDITAWDKQTVWSYVGDREPLPGIEVVPWTVERSYEMFMQCFWQLAPWNVKLRELKSK